MNLKISMYIDNTNNDMIKYVEDRNFNDFRYHITSKKLKSLGWLEQVSFEDGLRDTIEWYKNNSFLYQNIENALKAHPTF